jgi:hypothetical protein
VIRLLHPELAARKESVKTNELFHAAALIGTMKEPKRMKPSMKRPGKP